LKGPNLSIVKIADFGLSDFYRPGSTMRSNCGTLSFLSPEVFRGTANAGPPLDVWSLGVILFSILNGRLPFEDCCLSHRKRPRDAIVKSRIIKGQYKIDDRLSTEVKDLTRRLMKIDPEERASIPEVLSHCWMRQHQPTFLGESSKVTSFSRPRLPSNGMVRVESTSKVGQLTAITTAKSSFYSSTPNESAKDRPPSALQAASLDVMDEDSLQALVIQNDTIITGTSIVENNDITSPSRLPSGNTSRRASSEIEQLAKDVDTSFSSSMAQQSRRDSRLGIVSAAHDPPSSSSKVGINHVYDKLPTIGSPLLSAGMDIIGSPQMKDPKKSEEEENPAPVGIQISTGISPKSIASSSCSSNNSTQHNLFPHISSVNEISTNISSSSNPPSTTSSPFKLIPLRRDRSVSRNIEESIAMRLADDDRLPRSPSKSNIESIDETAETIVASLKNSTYPSSVNRQNSGTTTGAKNFQRSTISSSLQSNLPSTSRLFERERSNRSTASTSMSSLNNFSSQSSLGTNITSQISSSGMTAQDDSPSNTPRLSPSRNGRKETLADFAIEEENDHDDESSVARTSKHHRHHRHRQRSNSITGSTGILNSNHNKRDIPAPGGTSATSSMKLEVAVMSSNMVAEGIASSASKK
jgi:hypothetical protein